MRKLISLEQGLLLVVNAVFIGFCFNIEFNYVHKREYDKVAQSLTERDSMWYAHHDIDSQVQVLLTGVEDSAHIYKQIVAESGSFNSKQFVKNRNLFGFHNGKDYVKFQHWKESFDYYMERFYCDKRHNESFCAFIRRKKFGANNFVDYCTSK